MGFSLSFEHLATACLWATGFFLRFGGGSDSKHLLTNNIKAPHFDDGL